MVPNVESHVEPNVEQDVGDVSDRAVRHDEVSEGNEGSEGNESSEDSDFIVDEDNLLDDIDVDMKDFHLNIDKEVEWVRNVQHQLLSHSSIM